MLVYYDSTGSIEQLQQLLAELSSHDSVKAAMILACDSNGFLPDDVDPILKASKLPIFGGIFPAIIHDKYKYEKGTIVVGLQHMTNVAVVKGLNNANSCYKPQIKSSISCIEKVGTTFVFADGYSMHIGDFLSELEGLLPDSDSYIGGGTGSALPMTEGAAVTPSVFSNQGLLKDSVVIAHTELQCGIGVSHGFEPVEGPMQITSDKNNLILSLDGEPAVQTYIHMVSLLSGQQVNPDNVKEFFKAYPLGLISPEKGFIVRDLLAAQGNELVTVTHIPNGEYVYLVNGDKDSLIRAAAVANKEAITRFGDKPQSVTMLVECISRAFFLDEDLVQELTLFNPNNDHVIGFLSLGEIAKYSTEHVFLYNKTCIVGILGI